MRFTVVSWPAMSSRMQVASSSLSLSLSPASSAAIRAESMSSRGFARRSAISARKYSARARRPETLRWPTSESGGSMIASRPRAMSSPHCLNRSWSRTGTPSISQITFTGSG